MIPARNPGHSSAATQIRKVRDLARARQPGQGALVAAGCRYSAAASSLASGLFLAKLELRLRKDVELEREAPVLVLEGDPRAVPVALAAFGWC